MKNCKPGPETEGDREWEYTPDVNPSYGDNCEMKKNLEVVISRKVARKHFRSQRTLNQRYPSEHLHKLLTLFVFEFKARRFYYKIKMNVMKTTVTHEFVYAIVCRRLLQNSEEEEGIRAGLAEHWYITIASRIDENEDSWHTAQVECLQTEHQAPGKSLAIDQSIIFAM